MYHILKIERFCRKQVILVTSTDTLISGSSFDPEEICEFSHIDSYLLRSEFKQLEAWSFRHLCCAFIEKFSD